MSPKRFLRRFASAPTIKANNKRRLYTVAEQEDQAFKRQLAELEEPPEWDLNAGVGSEDFETPSLTPPPVTTSRATSPSRVVEKVTESSKKFRSRLVAIILEGPGRDSGDVRYNKNSHASRSLPDLSTAMGKGHAGTLTNSPPQEPRGRGRNPTPKQVDDRHKGHHHFPHSWRIPPQSALGRGPHIRESVPLPSFPFGQVNTKHHEFTVMARAMWKNGQIRYEDQWGRRIVPVGRQDSFMFELWPVAEGEEVEDIASSLSTATIEEEPEEFDLTVKK